MFGAALVHYGIIAFVVLIVICLLFGDDKAKKKLQKLANKPPVVVAY